MRRQVFAGVMLSMLGAAITPLVAQRRDVVSLDVTLGPSAGAGGRRNYIDEAGASAEITLGFRATPNEALSRVGAFSVGGRAELAFGDKCTIDFTLPTFGCRPNYPDMAHVGVLGGFEHRRSSHTSLRALVGPAFYAGEGASAVGGQLQLDAAGGFSHFALVVVARGNLVARFTGETMRFGSLGFGFRVQ